MSLTVISNAAEWDTFLQANSKNVILLSFTSPGCGLCRQMAGGMRGIRAQYANHDVVFAEIDSDNAIRLGWAWARVDGLPAFRIFRNGEKVEEWSGSRIETVDMRLSRYV